MVAIGSIAGALLFLMGLLFLAATKQIIDSPKSSDRTPTIVVGLVFYAVLCSTGAYLVLSSFDMLL